jgi:hypothetical protein
MNTPAKVHYSRYSAHEQAILNQHYNVASRETLLALLPGRTWKALNMQACRMKINERPFSVRYPRWSAASEQLMRELYPTNGGKFMAKLLGRTLKTIFQKAQRMKLRFTGTPKPPKPPRPPKAVKPPKPAPAPKPPKPEPLPKMKAAPPTLANHTKQKALKALGEKAQKSKVRYTSDDMRKLPYGDPVRQAHMQNGSAGVEAYYASLNQSPAA